MHLLVWTSLVLLSANLAVGNDVAEITSKLQGTWKLAATKHSDRDWSDAVVFDVYLVFDGDRMLTFFDTHIRPPTELAAKFDVVAAGDVYELREYAVRRNVRQDYVVQKSEFIIQEDSLIIARQLKHGKAGQAGTTTIERIQAFRRSDHEVEFSDETLAHYKPLSKRTEHRNAESAIRRFLHCLLLGDREELAQCIVDNSIDGFRFKEEELDPNARKRIKTQIASLVARDVADEDKLYERNGTPISFPEGEELTQKVALVPIVNGADWSHPVLVFKLDDEWRVDATPFAMRSKYGLQILHGIYLSMTAEEVREVIANDPDLTLIEEEEGKYHMLHVRVANSKKWPIRKLGFNDGKLFMSQNATLPTERAE